MNNKLALSFLLFMSAAVATAVNFEQKDKLSSSNTDLYDPAQWVQNASPGDGDSIQLPGYAVDKRIYLSASHTNSFATLWFKTGHRTVVEQGFAQLTFDTDGYDLLIPTNAAALKSTLLWQTYVPDGQSYPSKDYTIAEFTRRDASLHAPLRLSDFVLFQKTFSDFSTLVNFRKGTFNAFNPQESGIFEADSQDVYTLVLGGTYQGVDSAVPVVFEFSPEVVFKLPRLDIRKTANTVVNGAKIEVDGSFNHRGTTIVSNGAEIACGFLGGTGAGAWTHSSGSLTLAGENTRLSTKGNFIFHTGVITNKGATISLGKTFANHGVFVQESGTTCSAEYYYSDVNDSLFNLKGGSYQVMDGYGLYTGRGRFLIEGGCLKAQRFRNGRAEGGTVLFVQTGGEVNLSGNTRPGFWACETGVEVVRLELMGGTLSTPLVRGQSNLGTRTGSATLLGNGGKLTALADSPDDTTDKVPFLSGFNVVEVGPNGLLIDTQGYDVLVEQDISNSANANGKVVKLGSGVLSYAGVNSASRTEVKAGTWKLVDESTTMDTHLVLSGGAFFSLVGEAREVSIGAFTATNAVLALDAGDVISIDGPLSIRNLSIDWSTPPENWQPFLTMSGQLDEETVQGLKYLYASGLSSSHMEVDFSYDGSENKTTVRGRVVANSSVTAQALWTGSGVWPTPANWADGVLPDARRVAVFGAEGAGETVVVRDGDTAAELLFTNGSYLVSGDTALTIGGSSSARIGVESGSHKIACDLFTFRALSVDVASGSEIELSGLLSSRSLEKTGLGRFTLSGVMAAVNGFSISGGTVSACNHQALGATADDMALLKAGTLEIAQEFSGAIPSQVRVRTPGDQDAVVVNAQKDVAFADFSVEKGFLVKRGKGSMILNVPSETAWNLTVEKSPIGQKDASTAEDGINFPQDGSAPSGMRGPLSIVEGEVYIKGSGANARVNAPGNVYVTVPTVQNVASSPRLTVDNATLVCKQLYNGWCLGKAPFSAKSSSICALNGALVYWTESMPGYACTAQGCHATFAATNATFHYDGAPATYLTRGRLNDTSKTEPIVYYLLNDARFWMNSSLTLDGSIRVDLDNGSFWGRADGGCVGFTYGDAVRVYGEILVRGNSTLALSSIVEKTGIKRNLVLAFDNGEWKWADDYGDLTVKASTTGYLKYEMRGRGVILRPATGRRLTVEAPFEGEGGMVLDGPGTVAFGLNAFAFGGIADIRDGVLDLSAAGTLEGKQFAGGGIVKSGTLVSPAICISLSDDWENTNGVPVFTDCSLTGNVTVKTDRSSLSPIGRPAARKSIPVAKIAGTTTVDLDKWTLNRAGLRGAVGSFTLEDGIIYLNVSNAGLQVTVR